MPKAGKKPADATSTDSTSHSPTRPESHRRAKSRDKDKDVVDEKTPDSNHSHVVPIIGDFISPRSVGVFSLAHTTHTPRSAKDKPKHTTKELARQRRGLTKDGKETLTLNQRCDQKCDTFLGGGASEASCCTRPLRSRTETEETEGEAAQANDSKGAACSKEFGFPPFAESPYILDTTGHAWSDRFVHGRLGFMEAVHKKTSIQRMCLRIIKEKMPRNVTVAQVQQVLSTLKKCDHPNMLRLHDVLEDKQHLYLMYEFFPAVTLATVLQDNQWTQEQLANMVRELCGAAHYASSEGLFHLCWSTLHVLLHKDCLKDPEVLKLFGHGLMGNVHLDCSELACFAPEAIEVYEKKGELFLTMLDPATRAACDSWGLGTIIYAAIARRLPISGDPQSLARSIMTHKWSFSYSFDGIDSEARWLVEGFMDRNGDNRMKPKQALQNPWIRRRWDPPHPHKVFANLEKFVNECSARRSFGSFLKKFLDCNHMRKVTKLFYALDNQGDGVVDKQDLKILAQTLSDRPKHSIEIIWSRICPDDAPITVYRFAETVAEEILDGTMLRHAFESLDDDGSEEISAVELFSELAAVDKKLTLDDVMGYMRDAELSVQGSGQLSIDQKLDFEEFCKLFPSRVAFLKKLTHRVEKTQKQGKNCRLDLEAARDDMEKWLDHLQKEVDELEYLNVKAMEKHKLEEQSKMAHDILKKIKSCHRLLVEPAGLHDMSKATSHSRRPKSEEYGFGTFLQDHAVLSVWDHLIFDQKKRLENSLKGKKGEEDGVDLFAVNDAVSHAMLKLQDVLIWARGQMQEYECILEVIETPEEAIPTPMRSGRGIAATHDATQDEIDEEHDAEQRNANFFSWCR